MLAFSCYLSVCWVFVLLLPPYNRSPCLLMPGTPPGCHLTAGRDKRSSMETGKYSPQSHSLPLFQVKIYCLPALFFFFFLKSIKITTSCYPVPSICCHDLVYDWFESLAECLHWNVRKRQAQLADASDSSDTENWSRFCTHQSTEPGSELAAARRRWSPQKKTSLADSERNCQPVCSLYLVTSS